MRKALPSYVSLDLRGTATEQTAQEPEEHQHQSSRFRSTASYLTHFWCDGKKRTKDPRVSSLGRHHCKTSRKVVNRDVHFVKLKENLKKSGAEASADAPTSTNESSGIGQSSLPKSKRQSEQGGLSKEPSSKSKTKPSSKRSIGRGRTKRTAVMALAA
eukprot:CAMPEP_0118682306 /NCGR_PEP_ID=MMETSP0800-20121206/5415_1 /TAXON_ID=210618 ORGANISM="Striatella unipunctata, Strain CCMP2910" /NCGR_SAMPLE_ID=MMETSP0800 /ASSEMBLY_ACC=CAM_ASM_000638 /LENGTH=157 /DNA_ID=CAMNT_0006578687 /DNA_START=41 /DNA_END=514 /DNA_ORIENTATION=-